MNLKNLEINKFENGKGGCRKILTLTIEEFGKGGVKKMENGKMVGSNKNDLWNFEKEQHLGIQ